MLRLFLLLLPVVALAQRPPAPPAEEALTERRPGWVVDAATGCWVWHGAAVRPDQVRASWSGGCPGGPAQGEGMLTLIVGETEAVFTGRLAGGRPHGPGAVQAGGWRLAGTFRDGRAEGAGEETVPDDGTFAGTFRDGLRHGQGRFTWLNGDWYDGGWVAGRRHGRGTMASADGSVRFEGQWRHDRPDGPGRLTLDGTMNEGAWRAGCLFRPGQAPVAFLPGEHGCRP
jgi:hypothetical protein